MRRLNLVDLLVIAAVVVVLALVATRDSSRYIGRTVSAPTPAAAGDH